MATVGCPGGAQRSGVTTAAQAVNLNALSDREVDIWSDDQDLLYCFAKGAGNTALLYAGSQNANVNVLKASRIEKGKPARVWVWSRYPWLIVATVAGETTVHVKLVSY